jgi:uncharacterized protein YabN with tetrapyrrole methylase and pyrophosphatase domain
VLFQVHFLSLLMEERGAGDLAAVAEHCRQKLIRRHPHVFGDEAARSAAGYGRPEADRPDQDAGPDAPRGKPQNAADVLANWDEIKRAETGREPGVFGEVPENLPGPLYARKLQRRAASAGRHEAAEDPRDALARLDTTDRAARAAALGDALFALVDLARRERIDPELALRAAADRFRARVESSPDTTRSP